MMELECRFEEAHDPLSLSRFLGLLARLFGLAVEIQIGGIEIAGLLEFGKLKDREPFVLQLDKRLASQCLKRAVHMDRRQSEAACELVLGQRELVAQAACLSRYLKPKK